MGYTVDYLPEKGIITIAIEGRLDFSTAQKYSKEARKLAREYECSKYLIDHSETKRHEGIQKLYTGRDVLQQFGFSDADKIAIYVNCKKDDAILLEKTVANINWSTIKYFNTSKKAVNWLIDDR